MSMYDYDIYISSCIINTIKILFKKAISALNSIFFQRDLTVLMCIIPFAQIVPCSPTTTFSLILI
jgi:hypothetical protein